MSPVRLGAVEYLNARPLVFRLERHPQFMLRFDSPSRCAALLHDGAIDLGLIPSIEYLRGPAGSDYRVVPDLAVASRGPVASVALYTTRNAKDIRSIALDTTSRTSIALTRVLAARVFRISPVLHEQGPDLGAMLAEHDAALIIGDRALLLDGGVYPVGDREVEVEKIDLGEVWTRETGLPFVYAFWAGRPGPVAAADVAALHEARDCALGDLETVSAEYFTDDPALGPLGVRYLQDNIRYRLGADERAGLELFYRYAADAGVVSEGQALRFF